MLGEVSMSKSVWFIVITVLACVYLATVVFPYSPVTKAKCFTIPHGTSKREVRLLLGTPYDSRLGQDRYIGYDGCAILFFDADGRLVGRNWENLPYRTRFPENLTHPIQWPID